MARTGRVIIAKNIKLDKDYKDVLSYSETEMLNLVIENKVAEANDCSFIRVGENVIDTPFPYSTALRANYIALQNPSYDNKWFFGFIDKIEFMSNNNARIYYTIDEFSTWYSYWQPKTCFVVREHVTNDTLGLHTIPENIETGEYICNSHTKDTTMDAYSQDLCYIMASTSLPITGDAKDTVAGSGIYNGIYTGLKYYRYDVTNPIDIILELFTESGKLDAINGIFMAPKWLAPIDGLYRGVEESNAPLSYNVSISKQSTLNGYTPKNNKVKCFPYNYLIVSNNVGQNAILHYEKFSGTNATFQVNGLINPGCSINITPTNYNGSSVSNIDSIMLGKFPICNYVNDMYTNWLTQNSVNILGGNITTDDINLVSSSIGTILGVGASLGAGSIGSATSSLISGGSSIASNVIQKKQHNMIPSTVNGQLNSADINVASGNNTFHFYKMTVKEEYAKMIDDTFTRIGYQVNTLKIPNITGRTYYNYVQIGTDENIGYPTVSNYSVPPISMKIINDIFRRGTTVWHNHVHIGNYALDNSI